MFQNEDCGAREDVLRWADGYVLVYSVISKRSFLLLQEVQKKIEEFRKGASNPIVVLGNKSDMAHMRQVTNEEGMKKVILIVYFSGNPYVECMSSDHEYDIRK